MMIVFLKMTMMRGRDDVQSRIVVLKRSIQHPAWVYGVADTRRRQELIRQ
jgi:hypothetical protein